MQSEQINELAAALVAAQAEFSAVPKESANPFFKSSYAALPDVVKHATPVLARHGLAVSQFISEADTLTTYLLHKSGQFLSHTMTLHLVKDDPQAQGSAVTYARRYSYMACLGLVADNDDDGNAASQRGGTSARPAPQRASQSTTAPSQATGEKFDADPALVAYLVLADEINQNSEEPNATLTDITDRAQKYPLTAKQVGLAKKLADEAVRGAGLDPSAEFAKVAR